MVDLKADLRVVSARLDGTLARLPVFGLVSNLANV